MPTNENVCDHKNIKTPEEVTGGGWMTKRSRKSTGIIAKETATPLIVDRRLSEDIRGLIESAKSRFAQTANAALTDLPRRLHGAKLHEAIRLAREQIAVRGGGSGSRRRSRA